MAPIKVMSFLSNETYNAAVDLARLTVHAYFSHDHIVCLEAVLRSSRIQRPRTSEVAARLKLSEKVVNRVLSECKAARLVENEAVKGEATVTMYSTERNMVLFWFFDPLSFIDSLKYRHLQMQRVFETQASSNGPGEFFQCVSNTCYNGINGVKFELLQALELDDFKCDKCGAKMQQRVHQEVDHDLFALINQQLGPFYAAVSELTRMVQHDRELAHIQLEEDRRKEYNQSQSGRKDYRVLQKRHVILTDTSRPSRKLIQQIVSRTLALSNQKRSAFALPWQRQEQNTEVEKDVPVRGDLCTTWTEEDYRRETELQQRRMQEQSHCDTAPCPSLESMDPTSRDFFTLYSSIQCLDESFDQNC